MGYFMDSNKMIDIANFEQTIAKKISPVKATDKITSQDYSFQSDFIEGYTTMSP